MPYIQNGSVLADDRPVSFLDYLIHFFNLIVFFFTSIVGMDPVRYQIDTFNGSRSRNYGGSTTRGSGQGPQSPGGRNTNINTFKPAAQLGSCGSGG
jgi:hypothetical protein